MKTAITAFRLFTPLEVIERPVVLVEDGRIAALGGRHELEVPQDARLIDFPDHTLVPGFVDIHIHGGWGHDVMETSPSALAAIERGMARHGVTSYLPTTVTAPLDDTLRSLEHLGAHIRKRRTGADGATPLGIHLEGPFISRAKCGVHPVAHLLRPSPERLRQFCEASGQTVRMMTIAPELEGAPETIAEAAKLGVVSSMGHSDATLAQTRAGIASGARHVTHTFNAMRPLEHREPGILGAALTDDRLTADLIADGIHVAPEVAGLFLTAKGPDRAVLITDAISATGMPDGKYRLGGFEVDVRDGRCEFDGKLAGSVLTLDRALRNVMRFAAWDLKQSVRMVTENPARLLGVAHERGVLASGCIADLVALTDGHEVAATMLAGQIVS